MQDTTRGQGIETTSEEITGAEALVRVLAAEGVPFAFGIVGGKLAPLMHALSQRPSIRFMGVRHEAAGPMMAAAVHAGSGRMAVALGEMGPGGLNLASGVGVAFNNHLPLLAITTNQHRAAAYPHSGMFMDLETCAVLAPITKWNAVVHDPRRLPELVRRAFREALSGRPGPVHLDIPQDVLSARCSFPAGTFEVAPAHYRATVGPRPAQRLVMDAVALLRKARRPLIVAGGGVVASGAAEAVRTLAGVLRAPVVPTQMALGVVASNSPHCVGQGGLIAGEAVRQAFAQADVVLSIGCRYSSWMWDAQGPFVRPQFTEAGQQHININIDPSALGHPALHHVALQADAGQAVNDLLAALLADDVSVEADWLPRARAVRLDYEARLSTLGQDDGDPVMHPAVLARAIANAMPAGALAVFDGGHTSFWSNDLTPVQAERTRFHEPGMSHLGFGLPYALALQAQQPERAVLNITGDGSFGFTLNELDTARRYGLPVITVIHNNEAWGIIRAGQKSQYAFEYATSLQGTDYAAIARGFGCFGETVTRPEDVAPALARALASKLPAVLDCRTRFTPHPAGPGFGSMNKFGFDGLLHSQSAG